MATNVIRNGETFFVTTTTTRHTHEDNWWGP